MEWKILATVFVSVFIAEMADKTQLVTMLFAADREVSKWTVFLGSASALVLTSAIGVAAGALLAQVINVKMMTILAGAGFIVIGSWTLYHGIDQAKCEIGDRAFVLFLALFLHGFKTVRSSSINRNKASSMTSRGKSLCEAKVKEANRCCRATGTVIAQWSALAKATMLEPGITWS